MSGQAGGVIRWWAVVLAGAAAALLFGWLGRLTGVPLSFLLAVGVGAVALAWMIVLVTVPWNLFFAARQLVADQAVSLERGIAIGRDHGPEAQRIARRMLWFALGGHAVTAAVVAVITYFSGATVGYYFAGFYLLSTAARPAVAYLAHLKERITALTQESRYPREDVETLKRKVSAISSTVRETERALRGSQRTAADELHRVEANLTSSVAHTRQLLTTDLARLQDAQAAEQAAARSRDETLGRRIDQLVRRIEETLSGVSDHTELLTGLRALVRMVRSESV
jgi:hypothetical protein